MGKIKEKAAICEQLQELFDNVDKETIVQYLGNFFSSVELDELLEFVITEQENG